MLEKLHRQCNKSVCEILCRPFVKCFYVEKYLDWVLSVLATYVQQYYNIDMFCDAKNKVLTCFFLFFLFKQVERAFSVCGTIEYMAPEIVEGGESGHDKVNQGFSVKV